MNKLLFIISILLISCITSKNKRFDRKQNYYYVIGNFNRQFNSLKIEYDIEGKPTYYEYVFDKKKNVMSRKNNGKVDLFIYYDKNNLLDSVIDITFEPKRTTYFYKTDYRECYAKYSRENDIETDFINQKIDSIKNTVKFFVNGSLSSIDSFDSKKNLVKKTLLDSRTFQTYQYDSYGNIKNEYINLRIDNKDSLFNIINYDYEFDKFNNWTLKTFTKNYLNGKQLIIKTKRIIDYQSE